jgi:hypothetical protein
MNKTVNVKKKKTRRVYEGRIMLLKKGMYES